MMKALLDLKYKKRLRKARNAIAKSEIDGLLVSKQKDIEYLTGFFSEGAMLYVSKDELPIYYIDSMNEHLARRELSSAGVGVSSGCVLKEVSGHLNKKKGRRVGIYKENLTVSVHSSLFCSIKNVKVVQAPDILEKMRMIKDEDEISAIRVACREAASIWRAVRTKIVPGLTEREIARMIDTEIRGRGSALAFSTIAAVGMNTQHPHAVPTDCRLKSGEHVLLDFGAKKNGYCSDLTRIWVKGRMNRKIRELRKYVDLVHEDSIRRAAPGIMVRSLAKRVSETFIAAGLGKYVYHGLGHGVGLDIHELPFLSNTSTIRLKRGMVITIEPGLYMPGLGGIRKEDTLLITSKGCEVLTR